MADLVTTDSVTAATAVGGLIVSVISMRLSHRPGVNYHPPEMTAVDRRRDELGADLVALPPEIQEQLFLAEETTDQADDIAARDAAIAILEERIAQTPSASERMPLRRAVRQLRSEIDTIRKGKTNSVNSLAAAIFNPVWAVFYKLRPLRRQTRPWLAAFVGFVFGGIGLIIYFRALSDVAVLASLVAAMLVLGVLVGGNSWWIGAAAASIYGFLRSESSNRRLYLLAAPTPQTPSGVAA